MKGLLQYSNGWGHLIMSLAILATGLYLVITNHPGVGTALITAVSSAWFIPGAAKQIAYQVQAATGAASTDNKGDENV